MTTTTTDNQMGAEMPIEAPSREREQLAGFVWISSFLIVLAGALCLPQIACGQMIPLQDQKTPHTLQTAAGQGFPIRGVSTVSNSVSVQAVLLPEKICRHVFGREISSNYATVEITVSNHNHEASLIVQSIYLDLTAWLPAGGWKKDGAGSQLQGKDGEANGSQPFVAQTKRTQINSIESRIARDQLLDMQPWTGRNLVIRSLHLAGSLASAYAFSISEKGIVKGIANFNGLGIPAAETFWPDPTINQMNRLSDVGFQVNKMIAKDTSDIIVAFFPIDLFMSPQLKKLFFKSPALFFSPMQMVMDPKLKKQLDSMLEPLACDSGKCSAIISNFGHKLLDKYREKPLEFLNDLSLDSAHIAVSGVMTVDVSGVPAVVTSIQFDGDDSPEMWKTTGEKKGVIRGSFLPEGVPEIKEKDSLNIADPVTVVSESNDTKLRFTMNLKDPIEHPATLTFRVVKHDKSGNTIESKDFPVQINAKAPPKGPE